MKLSDMIDKARANGACLSAISELRRCATWEDALAHPFAGAWAFWCWNVNLLPASLCSAGEAYDMAVASAWDVCMDAVRKAQKKYVRPSRSYESAAEQAHEAYREVRRAAQRRLAEAIYEELKD